MKAIGIVMLMFIGLIFGNMVCDSGRVNARHMMIDKCRKECNMMNECSEHVNTISYSCTCKECN